MQFIKTNLCIENRDLKKNGASSWICVHANSKKCKRRGTLIEASFTLTINHSHFPDPDECVKRDFAASIKQKAKDTSEKPRKIILDTQESLPPIAAPILPDYKAMQSSVQRVRKHLAPTVENENSLKSFVLSSELKVTNTGEDFVFYDSGIGDEKRILIFATSSGIELLSNSDHWFCDGTFSSCPEIFYQLYTIHAMLQNHQFVYFTHFCQTKVNQLTNGSLKNWKQFCQKNYDRFRNCSQERPYKAEKKYRDKFLLFSSEAIDIQEGSERRSGTIVPE